MPRYVQSADPTCGDARSHTPNSGRMQTFFRVQPGHRDVHELLDPKTWRSRVWVGEAEKMCPECHGIGELYDAERCERCEGTGVVEDVRNGVSAFESLDELIAYFSDRGADLTGDVVVEFEGQRSEDEDWDARYGAVLAYPKKIVSVRPVQTIFSPGIVRKHEPNAGYYVWVIDARGAPVAGEVPHGPHPFESAKTAARIGATEGRHDRAVSLGRDPKSSSFRIVRAYRAGTGERVI